MNLRTFVQDQVWPHTAINILRKHMTEANKGGQFLGNFGGPI